jgi:hypothetical protein
MTSCVSFETANRLHPAGRPAGAVFVLPPNFGVSPDRWLAWMFQTRLQHLRAFYPRRPGESLEQYMARLSMIATQITVRAFASGARFPRIAFYGRVRPAGAGDSTDITKDTGDSSGSGGSGSTARAGIDAAAAILGSSATLIQHAIESGNETERARIDADARARIAQIQANMAASTDPAQQTAMQGMIDALSSIRAQLGQQTGLSTGAMVGIAVAGVAVLGGIAYVMTHRPSEHSRHNPVVIDHGRRRFVTSAWLRSHHGKGLRKVA